MYCSKCGAPNPDDAAFCAKCGANLAVAATSGTSSRSSSSEFSSPSTDSYSADSAQAFDDEAWRAVIGPRNVDYYLPRFRLQHATGRRARWHWPAFFVTFYWCLYRKQWLWALAYFFVPYIIAAILGTAIAAIASETRALAGALWLLYMAAMLLGPPFLANPLYYSHCKSLIERQRAGARSREQFLARLEAKGGTSNIAALIVSIIALVMLIGILAAVAIPAYQDYTKRAKSVEAISAGMAVAGLVGAEYERTGRIPQDLDHFAGVTQPSKFVTNMSIHPDTGVIELQVSFGVNSGGGAIYLVPNTTAGGKVIWSCRAEPAMTRFVPLSCRGK